MFKQRTARAGWLVGPALILIIGPLSAQQPAPALPSTALRYGVFKVTFAPEGAFTLQGQGWPTFTGTWKNEGGELTLGRPTR